MRWLTRIDGLVRVAVPAPDAASEAIVVVYAEKRRSYEVHRIDVDTGRIAWRRTVANGGYGSPAFLGDLVIVHTEFTGVEALRRHDGEPVWRFTTESRIRSSLVVDGERVVFSSGSELIALSRDGKEASRLHVPRAFLFGQPARWRNGWLTLATMTAGTGESRVVLLHLDERGAVLWNRDLGPGSIASSDTSGFVSAEDRIFVAGPDALFAIDAQSGGLIWRQPIAALAHRHTCVDDGRRLFYTTVEGHVGAVTREGAPLWERSLSAQGIWSPASVLGDRIVVPGNGLLHLLDATSGALIQQIAVGQCPYSALTFCGNRALLGGGDPPYWGMLIGFDVQADSRQGLTCAFAQQRRVAQADRPLDLVLQVSGCEEPIRRVSVDFSPLEGPASCAPDHREGDRFMFTVQPGPGQRWGAYALPVEVETSRAIYVSTAFLDLDDPSTAPRRVLLPGYADVVQEEMDWSGAALMAAVRRQYGDDVDQGAMRDMIDSIRDRSGYLPFDTWRIIARRALSTSARRTSELPEFRGDDPA